MTDRGKQMTLLHVKGKMKLVTLASSEKFGSCEVHHISPRLPTMSCSIFPRDIGAAPRASMTQRLRPNCLWLRFLVSASSAITGFVLVRRVLASVFA